MRVDYQANARRKAEAKFNEAAGDALLQKLKSASFSEIDNWVDANVTTLASAKTLFKKMLMIMSYLLNKS